MKADGVEIVRHAAKAAIDDAAELRLRKISPRGVRVESAQRQRGLPVLKTKRGIKAPLDQPGFETSVT
jgi:hypothetical protein